MTESKEAFGRRGDERDEKLRERVGSTRRTIVLLHFALSFLKEQCCGSSTHYRSPSTRRKACCNCLRLSSSTSLPINSTQFLLSLTRPWFVELSKCPSTLAVTVSTRARTERAFARRDRVAKPRREGGDDQDLKERLRRCGDTEATALARIQGFQGAFVLPSSGRNSRRRFEGEAATTAPPAGTKCSLTDEGEQPKEEGESRGRGAVGGEASITSSQTGTRFEGLRTHPQPANSVTASSLDITSFDHSSSWIQSNSPRRAILISPFLFFPSLLPPTESSTPRTLVASPRHPRLDSLTHI